MKLYVIVIGNYLNGFSANSMHCYLLQVRLPNIIQAEPAIHVYFHQFGSPLEMANNGNHFAYLEPITAQHIHTSNIISICHETKYHCNWELS